MKKILRSLILLAFASLAPAAFAEPQGADGLSAVPDSSEMVFSLDISKTLKLPFVEDLKKNDPELSKQFAELEQKLAKHGIKLQDFASSILIFVEGDGLGGAVVGTKIGEEKLESLLKGEIFGTPSKFSVEQIQGHKVFLLSGAQNSLIPDPAMAAAFAAGLDSDPAQKVVAATFIAPERLLFIEKSKLESYFGSKKGASPELLKRKESIDGSGVFWGVVKIPKGVSMQAPAQQNPLLPMPPGESKVEGAALSLDFTGQSSEDISLKLCLDCVDKAAAAAQSMQLQQLVWAFSMASQTGDPQTGMQMMNAIKISTKDNNVVLDVFLPKSLVEKLKGMAQSQMAKQMGGGLSADSDPFAKQKSNVSADSDPFAPSAGAPSGKPASRADTTLPKEPKASPANQP